MNSIDLVVIIATSYFLLRGLFRGFILELTIVIGLIAGYLAAISFLSIVSETLLLYFPQLPVSAAKIICFSLIFILVNLGLRLAANIITKTLKFAMLGWLNRLLGALFGLIKSLIILVMVVFLINLVPFSKIFLEKAGQDESYFYPFLEMMGPELYKHVQNVKIDDFLKYDK